MKINPANDGELDLSSRLVVEVRRSRVGGARLVAAAGLHGFNLLEAGTSPILFQNQSQPGRIAAGESKPPDGCGLTEIVRCRLKSKSLKAALLAPLFFSVSPLLAYAPWSSNNMLDRGDQSVLIAPVADFYHELDRMQLAPARFPAVTSTNSFAEETLQAELAGLREALAHAGKSTSAIEQIVASHLAERQKLQQFVDAFAEWKDSAPVEWVDGEERRGEPTASQPAFPSITVLSGLPGEFADYFDGAISWSNPNVPDKTAARQAWEKILNRPAAERQYKSTAAAFMLGRSWESEDPKKARAYYRQVRDLAAQGFADPTGLAAAGIGWEARLALRANEFQTAIELYLDQYAAGGSGAGESLRIALGRAVNAGPKALAPLALEPKTRRLVTAFLISDLHSNHSAASNGDPTTKAWLEAVERAGVNDVQSAEQFALAAYQADDMPAALRWVKRAGDSPVALWVEAKLFLRAGKVPEATELLSRIIESFPLEDPTDDTNQTETTFASSLLVSNDEGIVSAAHYIRGELGALKLSQHEYSQAYDLLLRGDFSADAAYLADHVLTLDELKTYVDANWPAIPPSTNTDDSDTNGPSSETALEQTTTSVRYLLARRLTRESRGLEARPYYPAEWLPAYDQFMQALGDGWNESFAADERAKALAAAAFIARTNGMNLFGTESAPDWHMYDGEFEGGVTEDSRTNGEPEILAPSADELKRASEQKTDPDLRFHFRYQAAALAWEAAKLMPNNSNETARLLCAAGSWIKYTDPKAADLFYKTLVRRCRSTAIGAKADEIHWFPDIDEDGNLRPARLELLDVPGAVEISDSEGIADYPTPGKHFIIQDGDHTRDIVAAVRRLGVPMTVKELHAANPELKPGDYTAGREIFIPSPGTTLPPESPSGANSEAIPNEPLQLIPNGD